MMMNEWLSVLPSLIAGLLLGLVHYGGLWLTIQRLSDARHLVLLTLASLVGRLVVTLLGIYLITGGNSIKIGACLLGLFVMRTILVQLWRPEAKQAVGGRGAHGT